MWNMTVFPLINGNMCLITLSSKGFSHSRWTNMNVGSLYHYTISPYLSNNCWRKHHFPFHRIDMRRLKKFARINSSCCTILPHSHLMNALRWASIAVAHTSSNSLYIIIIEHQFRFNCGKRVLNTPHRTAYVGLNVEKFMRIHLLDDLILLRGCR